MEIKANAKGSRFIEVTEQHLETIKKYSLFTDLIGSDGFIEETTLEKLRNNVRSLLEAGGASDKNLLDLCLDVIYHRDMKPIGLRNLMLFYINFYSGEEPDLEAFAADKALHVTEEDESEDKA